MSVSACSVSCLSICPSPLTAVFWPDFLSVRKIPLKEQPYLAAPGVSPTMPLEDDARPEDSEVPIFLDRMRQTLLTDRALHDLAAKAFVSFVRAYSKHEASYIFRVKDLDLVGIAKSFGLLRLPKMPELKGVKLQGWADAEVDVGTISFMISHRSDYVFGSGHRLHTRTPLRNRSA